MSEITRAPKARVGVDLAKLVFQVHAVDEHGHRVVARALKRDQFYGWCAQLPARCLVAMEACSSAHYWARKLRALGLDARLMVANFVSPYRMEGKNGKNDANDAAATQLSAANSHKVPVRHNWLASGQRAGNVCQRTDAPQIWV